MKDPAFLFYPNDWLGGTMGMTFEQKGAYMELLMLQFNRGHMTSHMIAHILGQNAGQIWDMIKDKFEQDENGLFYNRRLDEEQNKRKAYSESRRNNITGKNQHSNKEKKDVNNNQHMIGHMTSHMENENINENINEISIENKEEEHEQISILTFDEFWELYDKKVGDKTKLRKKFETIKEADRAKIIEHVPLYKAATPEKKYRKDPQTYINNKSWNDEIIQSNGNSRKDYSAIPNEQKQHELAAVVYKHFGSGQ